MKTWAMNYEDLLFPLQHNLNNSFKLIFETWYDELCIVDLWYKAFDTCSPHLQVGYSP